MNSDKNKKSIADELLRYAQMKEEGVLTEEEFMQRKKELLDSYLGEAAEKQESGKLDELLKQ